MSTKRFAKETEREKELKINKITNKVQCQLEDIRDLLKYIYMYFRARCKRRKYKVCICIFLCVFYSILINITNSEGVKRSFLKVAFCIHSHNVSKFYCCFRIASSLIYECNCDECAFPMEQNLKSSKWLKTK